MLRASSRLLSRPSGAAAAAPVARACASSLREAAPLAAWRRASSTDTHSDFAPKTKVATEDPAALKAQITEVRAAAAWVLCGLVWVAACRCAENVAALAAGAEWPRGTAG